MSSQLRLAADMKDGASPVLSKLKAEFKALQDQAGEGSSFEKLNKQIADLQTEMVANASPAVRKLKQELADLQKATAEGRAVGKLNKEIAQLKKEMSEVRSTPGMKAALGWFDKASAGASEFITKGGGAAGVINNLGIGGLSAAASLAGLVVQMKEIGERSLAMRELGREVGLSADQVNAFSHAGLHFGVSADTMNSALDHLAGQMPEFRRNMGPLYQELSRWPDLIKKLQGEGTQDQIKDIFNFLGQQKLQNEPQLQKQILGAFFGSGDQMEKLFAEGAKGFLDELAKQSKQLGTISPEMIEQAKEFRDAQTSFNNALANFETSVGPKFLKGMTAIVNEAKEFFETVNGKHPALETGKPTEKGATPAPREKSWGEWLGDAVNAMKAEEDLVPGPLDLWNRFSKWSEDAPKPVPHKSSFEGVPDKNLLHRTAFGLDDRDSGPVNTLAELQTLMREFSARHQDGPRHPISIFGERGNAGSIQAANPLTGSPAVLTGIVADGTKAGFLAAGLDDRGSVPVNTLAELQTLMREFSARHQDGPRHPISIFGERGNAGSIQAANPLTGSPAVLTGIVADGTKAGFLAAMRELMVQSDLDKANGGGPLINASYGGQGRPRFGAGTGGHGFGGQPRGSVDDYSERSSAGNLTKLIEAEARRAGIDPRIMEGIRAGESGHTEKYDHNPGTPGRPEDSWGPFQLNRRSGLGVQFERETHLDLSDPNTIGAQARWVANYLKHGGSLRPWAGFHGPRDANPRWGDSGYKPSEDATMGLPKVAAGSSYPGHITGQMKIGDQSYRFGSGGVRGSSSIPFGDHEITPNSVGPWGRSVGALGIDNEKIWDKALGRMRFGIEMHLGHSANLITEGCIAFEKSQWPKVKGQVLDMIRQHGHAYLHVDQNGASITPRRADGLDGDQPVPRRANGQLGDQAPNAGRVPDPPGGHIRADIHVHGAPHKTSIRTEGQITAKLHRWQTMTQPSDSA